ncbi:MAG TPA: hypothetical protein VGO96_02280 [Pyrinomonadaceae bacterium]|jgi:hypothetical protein|nr:hypothetical protein [Pyrinomonadaceae bacterium]
MKRTKKTKDIDKHDVGTDSKVEGLVPKYDKPLAKTSDDLEAEQRARTWEHGLHEDKLFNDRLNFFSFLESALLGIFGVLYSKQPSAPKSFLYSLGGLGLASTLIWLFIQLRQMFYLKHLVSKSIKILPEFRETLDGFSKNKWWRRFSVTRLLAVFIPVLFFIVWALTIFFMYTSA